MKKSFFITLLFLVTFTLFPIDISIPGVVSIDESQNGKTDYTLNLADGTSFTITADKPVDETNAVRVQKVLTDILAIESLVISRANLTIHDTRIELVIVPKSFIYDDIALESYMPAGMKFIYETFLEYNFRLLAENMFIRISGQFFGEKLFGEKLVSAAKSPIEYIQRHDPEYVLRRFKDYDDTIEAMKADNLQRVADDENITEHFTQELNETKTTLTGNLETKYTELLEKYDDLNSKYETLLKAFETHRYGALAYYNKGWPFGNLQPIPQDVIDRVLALKQSNASIEFKEIVETMRDEKMTFNDYQVKTILAVYFNEFPE